MRLKKLEQTCSISRDLVYVSQKIEQACSISRHLIYASKKLKQACSISGDLVYVSKKNSTGLFYFKIPYKSVAIDTELIRNISYNRTIR